ncbi:hypothetical protein Ancab_028638 [Ancistrocladus abbreviatus]
MDFDDNSGGSDRCSYRDCNQIEEWKLEVGVTSVLGPPAGKLVDNKIPWRGDYALSDGSEAKLDLSKGMCDVGDHMKFGFPMAYTATVLSWVILEYGDQMDAIKQLEPAKAVLKWITDYLVNAHPKDNVLYIQVELINKGRNSVRFILVGDLVLDHKCWDRPETMSEKRPLTQINITTPGTEVAAETAAAIAAASLVFKTSDSTYSSTPLNHAKRLFSFADNTEVLTVKTFPKLQLIITLPVMEMSSYGLLVGSTMQLGMIHTSAMETSEAIMCGLLPDSPTATSSKTDSNCSSLAITDLNNHANYYFSCLSVASENRSVCMVPIVSGMFGRFYGQPLTRGLMWVSEWNSLQQPVASAFLAAVYSDYMISSRTVSISCSGKSYRPSDLRKFARSQVIGDKYPQFVHHRGASISANADTSCKDGFKWLESKKPNPNVAIGALVGGPFLNESFIDSRNNSMQTEPSTYNSAILVGLLSSLVTTSSVVQSFT